MCVCDCLLLLLLLFVCFISYTFLCYSTSYVGANGNIGHTEKFSFTMAIGVQCSHRTHPAYMHTHSVLYNSIFQRLPNNSKCHQKLSVCELSFFFPRVCILRKMCLVGCLLVLPPIFFLLLLYGNLGKLSGKHIHSLIHTHTHTATNNRNEK